MEAVKGFLAPLGLNTNSIQDTLVRKPLTLSIPRSRVLNHPFTETSRHRGNSRNCAQGVNIRMEWICRLSVYYFPVQWRL